MTVRENRAVEFRHAHESEKVQLFKISSEASALMNGEVREMGAGWEPGVGGGGSCRGSGGVWPGVMGVSTQG